jgi:hypothetical protein
MPEVAKCLSETNRLIYLDSISYFNQNNINLYNRIDNFTRYDGSNKTKLNLFYTLNKPKQMSESLTFLIVYSALLQNYPFIIEIMNMHDMYLSHVKSVTHFQGGYLTSDISYRHLPRTLASLLKIDDATLFDDIDYHKRFSRLPFDIISSIFPGLSFVENLSDLIYNNDIIHVTDYISPPSLDFDYDLFLNPTVLPAFRPFYTRDKSSRSILFKSFNNFNLNHNDVLDTRYLIEEDDEYDIQPNIFR